MILDVVKGRNVEQGNEEKVETEYEPIVAKLVLNENLE